MIWKDVGVSGARRVTRQRMNEEVARVRIGVDEMMEEDLFQVDVVQPPRDLGAADAGGLDGLHVIYLDAGDILQGQHATGGIFPEHVGDVDARITREISREPIGVPPLGDEVQLGAGGGRELIVEPVQLNATGDRPIPLQPIHRQSQGCQVGSDQPFDARALDLDHDFLAIHEPRLVHLRQ